MNMHDISTLLEKYDFKYIKIVKTFMIRIYDTIMIVQPTTIVLACPTKTILYFCRKFLQVDVQFGP